MKAIFTAPLRALIGFAFATGMTAVSLSSSAAPPNPAAQPPATTTHPVETTRPPAATAMTPQAWRALVIQRAAPRAGCFKTVYPNLQHVEVPCVQAPNRPFPPRAGGHAQTVGNGLDYAAQTAGLISSATGSFDDATSVSSESNSNGTNNDYSLQVNSSFFTSAACNNPGCQGWQQFVYSNTGYGVMQYWLLNYTMPCPAGWNTYAPHCWKNGTAINIPIQPIANFKNLTLNGIAVNGGLDTYNFSDGTTTYTTTGNDNVVGLAAHWNLAEYNVFGDCCSTQANFNAGTHIIVRTTINDGTQNAPSCVTAGFTGETNNTTLVMCCPYGGANPHIAFDESNNANPSAICMNGTAIGDTHLTNLNHWYYDFQATGDFVLAQTDPDFVVQNRQISGAPSWPNASINKYIGMKMGSDRVAICTQPNRLIVNGAVNNLADGGSVALPGVYITRSANVYTFTRPNGDNVKTTINDNGANTWIDVALGFSNPRPAVHGLLGNSLGNGGGSTDLVSRTGAVLHQPVSFNDLYHTYGDSWRVDGASLPGQLCGDAVKLVRANPVKPFFAKDLKPQDYAKARDICVKEGVNRETPLMDSCILDTAVLNIKTAAHVYLHTARPAGLVKLNLAQLKPMQQPPPIRDK